MIRQIAACLILAVATAASALASDLVISAEHAEIVRLPADASAVVVGNPSIADAMVHDGRTLVLTGRLQGRTNVIALDRVGRIIYSREVVVTNPIAGQVALFRGPNRHTLSCADVCDAVPRVGDDPAATSATTEQQTNRLEVAESALGDDNSD
jgi:Flp pilus assembly secretin CpaC